MILGEQSQLSERVSERSKPLSRQQRRLLTGICLVVGDLLALSIAFALAYWIRFKILPYGSTFDLQVYVLLVASTFPIWLLIFAAFQLYDTHILFGGLQEYSRAFNAVSLSAVAMMVISFLRRDDMMVSRGWLILSWMLAAFLVIGMRFTLRRVVYALRTRGHLLSPALVVGVDPSSLAIADQLRQRNTSGLYLVGFVDDHLAPGTAIENGFKVLGKLEDLEELTARYQVQEIIISPSTVKREQQLSIFRSFIANPEIILSLSSGLFEILTTRLRVKELSSVPLIEVNDSRISGLDAFLKWMLDYCLTIPILLLISPVLLLIAIAVKLDSPGPVLFRRRVMGANGQQFDAFKFRTMHANGDEILLNYPELQTELANNYKLKDDPRVTRLGDFLRRYSLDELPQFFNVLLGQMSLVGPRMISPPEMEEYGKWGMNLLTVKPGITGLWQVSGRSDISYEERVRLDMHYIRNWTIWLDIYMLLSTIPAVIRKRGAY
jgi:exopolysaccharide biosynthesis polyprenyl glycosylphosphotransferase